MTYKLLDAAQACWRISNGSKLVKKLLDGATFTEGIKGTDNETTTDDRPAAQCVVSTRWDLCGRHPNALRRDHPRVAA
jgi:hypothetical protein